jgi:NAD(P)-dependent dehydrogenase (short-subunit alcohol dehydrogenase family)
MSGAVEGLADRAVVVTGAAGGIGQAVARALADAGSHVVAVDRPSAPLDETVAALAGEHHLAIAADLTELSAHEMIFRQAADIAPLAGMFHAAAVIRRQADIDDVTEADFDAQVDVNLKATFFLARACWRALRTEGGGAIVNVASQGWWTGGFGGSVVYSATKGGVVTLGRGLARTFAPDRVRVNTIAPGLVDTAMMREGVSDQTRADLVATVPLGRMASPEELTGGALFLLSDAAAYITGAVLNVSGGQLMY